MSSPMQGFERDTLAAVRSSKAHNCGQRGPLNGANFEFPQSQSQRNEPDRSTRAVTDLSA